MSSCSETPENKHPNMTQELLVFFFLFFFTPTAADCSLTALLGSVEKKNSHLTFSHHSSGAPPHSAWSINSLSLFLFLTHMYTCTSIMAHPHLPSSAVSHRCNSPCSRRPLLTVAPSCWLCTKKNISSLVCLLNGKLLNVKRPLYWRTRGRRRSSVEPPNKWKDLQL